MDFSWTTYFNGFWMFPLLCMLLMAIMMLACGVRRRGCGHGGRHGSAD